MKKIFCMIMITLLSCGPESPEECERDCFTCDDSGCSAMLDCLCDCDAQCKND